MKRVFLLSIVTVILCFSSVFAEGGRTIIYVDQLKGAEMPKNIDKPEWRCLKIDTNGITVSFREKYGAEIVKQCIGVWYNDKQYMFTHKNKPGDIIEMSNITKFGFVE